MRLIVLSVMGLMAGLGLAAAIVAVPVNADKGPLRATLVAHLGGGQEEVPGGGDPDGRGRAVVEVFKEQLCATLETRAIETSSSKATIHLGMSGENGPAVANLEEQAASSPPGTTTPTTTTTTTVPQATTTPQSTTPATTASPQATTPQTTTTAPQTTTMPQTSPSQSTAAPTASASAASAASAASSASAASASAPSASAATILEDAGGCVGVPRALSMELGEHPPRFYVNVTDGRYPEGAIRGQLRRGGDDNHRSGDNDD